LVRYLAGLGLETKLASMACEDAWDETANAGLEHLPLATPEDLPYVIKSPWTYQYIEQLLATPEIELDAVVIPLRDLTEAAASRCVLELRNMHSIHPWMSEMEQTWEDFAHTPGGVVYSLNPVDEARLLAVGLHRLLDQLVKADIPVILLSFPRLIEDADYLFRKLSPILSQEISAEDARLAHAETADMAKVRVGGELKDATIPGGRLNIRGPGHAQLDRVALARLLAETRKQVEETEARLTQLTDSHAGELARAMARIEDGQNEQDRLEQELAGAKSEAAALTQARHRLEQELAAALKTISRLTHERAQFKHLFETIEGSVTWRAARFLRGTVALIPGFTTIARRLHGS
jgi:hypothetical protein